MSVQVPFSKKLTFDDIEPFVFVFVVVRPGPTAGWSDVEKRRELLAGLFAIEQYDHCVAKRCSVWPSLARTKREAASGEMGALVSTLGGLINGVFERKGKQHASTFHQSAISTLP
jgi:hypothetical protein